MVQVMGKLILSETVSCVYKVENQGHETHKLFTDWLSVRWRNYLFLLAFLFNFCLRASVKPDSSHVVTCLKLCHVWPVNKIFRNVWEPYNKFFQC